MFLAAFESVTHTVYGSNADAAKPSVREYCKVAVPDLPKIRKAELVVPIAYIRDTAIHGGTCWNLYTVALGLSSVDLITRIWLVCLPVPVLMRTQASIERKILLIVLCIVERFLHAFLL